MKNPKTRVSMTAAAPVLAGRGARLGAVLLDLLIFSLFLIPGALVMSSSDSDIGKGFGWALLGVGWLGLLITQMVFLVKRGQSLGKMVVGIKIVRVSDGSVPGFVKVVLLRMVVPTLLECIPYAGALIGLVDLLFIFRDDRRCLHDLIAETKVVDAQDKPPEATATSQHQTRENIKTASVTQSLSVKEASTISVSSGAIHSSLVNSVDTIVDEDRIYNTIANELENSATEKGLWTRLFAECNGDLQQVKIQYIKQRAEHLISSERSRLEQAAHEQAAESCRLERLRVQSMSLREKLIEGNVTKELSDALGALSTTETAKKLLNNVLRRNITAVTSMLEEDPLLIAITNSVGDTPLHFAIRVKDLAMVRFLFGKGAMLNASNIYGVTPIDLANKSDHAEIIKLLMAPPTQHDAQPIIPPDAAR